jgi:hypothetical protein
LATRARADPTGREAPPSHPLSAGRPHSTAPRLGIAYAKAHAGLTARDVERLAPFQTPRAFVYSHGTMQDLNTLIGSHELSLSWAYDVNDAGEIVGIGTTSLGEVHGFVLIPLVPG